METEKRQKKEGEDLSWGGDGEQREDIMNKPATPNVI